MLNTLDIRFTNTWVWLAEPNSKARVYEAIIT